MAKEILVEPVADNYEKRDAFKMWLGQHKTAMEQGFYLEAVMIDYALLEERLLQMLYYMGFTDGSWSTKKKKVKLIKDREGFLKRIVEQYMGKKAGDKDSVSIYQITSKLDLVRCVLEWAARVEDGYRDDPFLNDLKFRCEGLDIQYLQETLKGIHDWCDYRNELVHTLFNKNADAVKLLLRDHAEKGLKLARALDGQVRAMKPRDRQDS